MTEMDDIKIRKGRYTDSRAHHRPAGIRPAAVRKPVQILQNHSYKHTRAVGRLAVKSHKRIKQGIVSRWLRTLNELPLFKSRMTRATLLLMAGLIILTEVITVFTPHLSKQAFAMGTAEKLLPTRNYAIGQKLQHDIKSGTYNFNAGYAPSSEGTIVNGGPKISATAYDDPSKGMNVTDPFNKVEFGLKPKFNLAAPKQEDNRLVYPLADKSGWLVYTMQAAQVKEDVLLTYANSDKMVLNYELVLNDAMDARLDSDGNIGVYGTDLPISGNVTTGSDKDAALLQKARQKATKNKLLFTLPAPIVHENNKTKSDVKTKFELHNGNQLTVTVSGLKKAQYPLTIDPSVYVNTAAQFMRGNNDSNIDFDTSNGLIQKGALTGGRISAWSSTTSLPVSRWGHGTIVTGGYIYIVGGNDGTSDQSSVYWAKIDPNNYTIVAADPGTGACSVWCTDTAYNLPGTRSQAATVTYNGYIYVVGGKGTNTGCSGGLCGTIYYSKIGANGEPNAWAINSVNLPNNDQFRSPAATVYNNYIYLSGGLSNASQNGVNDVNYAAINPDGSTSSWTSTTSLPNSVGGNGGDKRWGHTMMQYNGYMYIVGGLNISGVAENKVWYTKINSDGTFASSWIQTSSFITGRLSYGGNFAQIWGGYMYIAGGCSSVSGQNCTSFLNDLQLASINADGTIGTWAQIGDVSLPASNAGLGFIAWRSTLYAVGGCSNMASGNCTSASTTISYGHMNGDGGVAPKISRTTLPSMGTGSTNGGRIASGVVVSDGYIYNIGGCIQVDCTGGLFTAGMTGNTSMAPINADGSIGTWTVNSTNTLNGSAGLGAFGSTVYNNMVYIAGGTDGRNDWKASIYHATLSGGTSGAWTEQINQLPHSGYGYPVVFARAATATTGYLYVISGCYSNANGIGCDTYYTDVLRCTITNSTGNVSGCATTNQLQIQDLDAATAGTQGLGLTAGAIWGDYIYLAGGACGGGSASGQDTNSCNGTSTTSAGNTAEINKIYFAKIDSSGNLVRADNGSNSGGWQIAASSLPRVRRREVAFTTNGYLYVAAGHDGTTGNTGTLSDLAYYKIDPITGDLGTYTQVVQSGSTDDIINSRWNLGYVVANGNLYFVGGCTTGNPPASCSAADGTVISLQVYNNASGSPASFATDATIGVDRIGGSATVLNGFIYYAGGCTNIGCTAVTNTTYYAAILSDGTIGTWAAGGNLPASVAWGKLVNAGGTLYYVGGQNASATAQSTIYYTSSFSSGNPTWAGTAATKGVGDTGSGAVTRTSAGVSVFNNKIYITGGSSGGTAQTSVYISPNLSSGGNITSNWISSTSFNTARSGHVAVAYGSTLYIMGGFDGTNYLNDVQYAPIDSSGSIGSWNYSTSLPQPVRDGDGFAANGYLYVVGGRSASTTCTTNTYVAPIIGYTPGSSVRYGIGNWSQTNVKFTGARYGAASVYNDGKLFVLGGGCTAFVSSTDRSYYGTLQAQPQISRYSLAIDADLDVFPTVWLMNGIDNGTGARWLFSYRSATSGAASACGNMTAWGQVTSFGTVTLGKPETYIAKNSSGTNTNCARYFYLMATVDASQSFGYPEDVTRGPTVTDISFQYFSNPGRRLLHGKAFNGGEQQPLDTPCRQSGGANNSSCPLP